MNFRIIACFLIFLATACATNQTTKHGQKKGKWVYYRTDGQIEREEYYKPIKGTVPTDIAFSLGWKLKHSSDSVIYGEELIRIKEYHYNNNDLQRIERIDTSFIPEYLFRYIPEYRNFSK